MAAKAVERYYTGLAHRQVADAVNRGEAVVLPSGQITSGRVSQNGQLTFVPGFAIPNPGRYQGKMGDRTIGMEIDDLGRVVHLEGTILERPHESELHTGQVM